MAKITYIERNFQPLSWQIIDDANTIIEEYQARGYELTLRQLYYQFVARDLLPDEWEDKKTHVKNRVESYKKLGSIINDARLAGYIDWDAIADRTREVKNAPAWKSPADILRVAAEQYTPDMWAGQEYRPYVLVEKEALLDVVARTCQRENVNFGAMKGYASASTMHDLAMRMVDYEKAGQTPIILHLGDHDPSGLDMTRDIRERLSLFVGRHIDWDDRFGDYEIQIDRLALNIAQVRQYNPPPNPAKDKDSRFDEYEATFGKSSWELDALPPDIIDAIIMAAINQYRNKKVWAGHNAQRAADRKKLISFAETWEA